MDNNEFIPGPELGVPARHQVRITMFAKAALVLGRDANVVPHTDLPRKLHVAVKTLVVAPGALTLCELE